jgi:hypothetical protein
VPHAKGHGLVSAIAIYRPSHPHPSRIGFSQYIYGRALEEQRPFRHVLILFAPERSTIIKGYLAASLHAG